ncbi:MAG: hypothetical protein FH756_10805 [Firmicutes bacterium]|nr:hypothetical protein [Bacillota bacterium]
MSKLQKLKDVAKAVWNDNSGASETIQIVGYAIAAISLAGVVAALGITASKQTAADVSTDLTNFNVDASAITDTSATSNTFTLGNGERSVDTVTLDK